MAQPHILHVSQVCGVYVSYKCEAGLESLHIGVKIAFTEWPSLTFYISQVCGVYVSYECEAGLESVHVGGKKPSVA